MKATISINGKPIEIELTPEQIAEVDSYKFQWKYPIDHTFLLETDAVYSNYDGKGIAYLEYGMYRKTKEAAEQSLARNKRANRLEALAEQLGGLMKYRLKERHYYVYFNCGIWVKSDTINYQPGVVYMTKDCATEICRMLNEGEFSLEGEL